MHIINISCTCIWFCLLVPFSFCLCLIIPLSSFHVEFTSPCSFSLFIPHVLFLFLHLLLYFYWNFSIVPSHPLLSLHFHPIQSFFAHPFPISPPFIHSFLMYCSEIHQTFFQYSRPPIHLPHMHHAAEEGRFLSPPAVLMTKLRQILQGTVQFFCFLPHSLRISSSW